MKRLRVRCLIEAVLPQLEVMPAAQKADVYDGIAEVTAHLDPEMHNAAVSIAEQLRDADQMQLNFKGLLGTEYKV